MNIKISLKDYSETSGNSKMFATNATDNQVGADTNKKIAKRAEKHDVNNPLLCFDDVVEKQSQMDLYSENNASAQENNQVKENDGNRSEISEISAHRSEQPEQINRHCRCGEDIKEKILKLLLKIAESKSPLIPLECSKLKNNAVYADNEPVENKQNGYGTAQKFILMPFDKQTKPNEFALLQQYLQDARCEEPESFVDLKHAKVYKVNCDGFDSNDFKFGNCFMLHGTSFEGSRKILNEGYRNSAYGCFGTGVYMTESIDMAVHYSIRKTCSIWREPFHRNTLMKTYIFINQVCVLKCLKVEKYESYKRLYDHYAALKHPYCKHVHQNGPDRKMKIDAEGRLNSHRKITGLNLGDEYVADDSLVKPRFLIEIEPFGIDYEKYMNLTMFLCKKIK